MQGLRTLVTTVWARHEVRYLVVAGCVSVLSWFSVWAGLRLGWNYMVATVFGQIAPIPVAFPAYRYIVFASRGRLGPDFARFISVWASGMVAPIVGTPLLVEGIHMDPVVAQVVITGVVAITSYLGHRFFSFRQHHRGAEHVEEPKAQEI